MPVDTPGRRRMASQPGPRITPAQYLEAERRAEHKSEYFAGEVFAMTGASRAHNFIVTNLIIALGTQLRSRPCDVYPSDMRVRVAETGLYTYPDVAVVCGEARFEDEHVDTLLNPTVLIEVLSPRRRAPTAAARPSTTGAWDRSRSTCSCHRRRRAWSATGGKASVSGC